MIPAPSVLDPRINPAGAESQRRQVLEIMADEGMITDQAARPGPGPAPHPGPGGRDRRPGHGHRSSTRRPPEVVKYPYFTDYVRRYLIARYGEEMVYTGGLRVETSLDPRLQAVAEASVTKTLQGTPAGLEMALVSLDPRNGLVRALVGGRDFAKSNVNLALGNCDAVKPVEPEPDQSRSRCASPAAAPAASRARPSSPSPWPPPSTPGASPPTTYRGPGEYTYPNCRGEGCTVRNTESGSYGSLTLAQATAYSVNTVFAQLILDVGIKETAQMANKLGLTMIDPEGNLPVGRALRAQPHPGRGRGVAPRHGRRLRRVLGPGPAVPGLPGGQGHRSRRARSWRTTPPAGPTRVLAQAVADEMNSVLTGGVEFGTGAGAKIDRPGGTAGKTGTSEGFGDAWFVGYTPELSTSVWMGYADSRKAMENIKGVAKVFGGTLPAATWKDYMSQGPGGRAQEHLPPAAPGGAAGPGRGQHARRPRPAAHASSRCRRHGDHTSDTLPPYVPPFGGPPLTPDTTSPRTVPPPSPRPYDPTQIDVPTGRRARPRPAAPRGDADDPRPADPRPVLPGRRWSSTRPCPGGS